MVIITLF